MNPRPSIVWFRRNLRLTDNPALAAACRRGGAVVPLFIWAPEEEGRWSPGAASRWWLHQSLRELDRDLRASGSSLILRTGPVLRALREILADTGAGAVYWDRLYEPHAARRDVILKEDLVAAGIEVETFNASLLFEPWTVVTGAGGPYRVFTPYYRACLGRIPSTAGEPEPAGIPPPEKPPRSLPLAALGLEPTVDWTAGLRATWSPGEKGARAKLDRFREDALREYPEGRDRPDRSGTSALSPHLHFGEIGPRQVWRAIEQASSSRRAHGWLAAAEAFQRQLIWREFAHQVLFRFPHTPAKPLNPEFGAFPWRRSKKLLHAWQRGRTGYPIVDAGMRQLWKTGWMHNRIRMAVASFLVKDLLIPWQEGAAWFWDTLVDADLANNTFGWQWAAGCGADAAPYFRIFNPVLQGSKFDPDGAYVRRWVPELDRMPAGWIHRPWQAPAGVPGQAGVVMGETYPVPIVDHALARKRALAAFASMRRKGPSR